MAMWVARSRAVTWVKSTAIGVIDDVLTLLPEPEGHVREALLVDEGAQTDLSGRVRVKCGVSVDVRVYSSV